MNKRLTDELKSFKGIWKGGYFEGDPLSPVAKSTYGKLGFMSVLHATYLRCIKPYVGKDTVALEIGPGRGAWTKTLLPSKEVFVLDALSAEHNGFFEYLGHPENVKYFQVEDFDCEILPDDYFSYMFSFGCLCHVSFEGITKYAVNVYPKLKKGSNCFWLVADYDKHNNAISSLESLNVLTESIPQKYFPLKQLLLYFLKRKEPNFLNSDEDDTPTPGRWYHAGVERTCLMLQNAGYKIIDSDVGTCHRDPIIHFTKV
jgi:hypothetical protein